MPYQYVTRLRAKTDGGANSTLTDMSQVFPGDNPHAEGDDVEHDGETWKVTEVYPGDGGVTFVVIERPGELIPIQAL